MVHQRPARDFNLSDFLPYRLAVLSARVSKRLSLVYTEDHRLTVPEWRVLAHLSRSEKISVRDFHDHVNLEKPQVSRAVARLEKAGLVEKTGNASDQRLVEVSMTPAGWQVLDAILPRALAFEAELLDALSPDEADQLVALMERLHARLDRDPKATRRSAMDNG